MIIRKYVDIEKSPILHGIAQYSQKCGIKESVTILDFSPPLSLPLFSQLFVAVGLLFLEYCLLAKLCTSLLHIKMEQCFSLVYHPRGHLIKIKSPKGSFCKLSKWSMVIFTFYSLVQFSLRKYCTFFSDSV